MKNNEYTIVGVPLTIKTNKKRLEGKTVLRGKLDANFGSMEPIVFKDCGTIYDEERGERNWIPIKVRKELGMRITRHRVTGEHRVLFSLTNRFLENMERRTSIDMAYELETLVDDLWKNRPPKEDQPSN